MNSSNPELFAEGEWNRLLRASEVLIKAFCEAETEMIKDDCFQLLLISLIWLLAEMWKC